MNTPRHRSPTRSLLATVAVVIPAMLIGSGLSGPAHAGYMVTLDEVGSNVVATGSGTLDLDSLFGPQFNSAGQINASLGTLVTGPASAEPALFLNGGSGVITGPTSFGSGGGVFADSGSGDIVGISGSGATGGAVLIVSAGYVSGNPLSDTSTYLNQTFTSLGVTPGTYSWTWSTDSFTLQVGPLAVPAPAIGRGLSSFWPWAGCCLVRSYWSGATNAEIQFS